MSEGMGDATVGVAKTGATSLMKKPSTLILLALAAGVGYLWWTRQSQATAANTPVAVDWSTPDGGYTDPRGAAVGDASVISNAVPNKVTTNAEWQSAATDSLSAMGFSTALVNDALGKYLSSEPLTTQEVNWVSIAIRLWGQPPEGNPRLVNAPPTTTPPVTVPPVSTKKFTLSGTKAYVTPGSTTWSNIMAQYPAGTSMAEVKWWNSSHSISATVNGKRKANNPAASAYSTMGVGTVLALPAKATPVTT